MIPESRRNQAAKDEVIGSLCRITTELANVVVEDMLEVEVVTALYAVVYHNQPKKRTLGGARFLQTKLEKLHGEPMVLDA